MKRLYYILIAVLILTAILTACTADTTILPTRVRINYSSYTLIPGEILTLTANITPNEAVIKTVSWSSSNPEIATVTDGVVTAIAEGEAKITVTTNSGQKSAGCRLTVAYPVSGVTLDKTVAMLPIGESVRLTATVLPEDAPDKSFKWESSAPDVATVSENGTVIAKASGTAFITAITEVGNKMATCTIKVLPSGNYISMIWQPWQYEDNGIFLVGNGTVEIDWGDDSASETITLSGGAYYSHSYSDTRLYAVIINSNNNITRLVCSNELLTNLDVSANSALRELDCSNNLLKSLDVSNNTELITLRCFNNQLANLDLSANTKLTTLRCYDNQLISLNVSNNMALTELYCSNNHLTSLDIGAHTSIRVLDCSNNNLTSLDVSNNVGLDIIDCSNNQLTNLDLSNLIVLRKLDCSGNRLVSLAVGSGDGLLTLLNCQYNQLSADGLNNLFGMLLRGGDLQIIYPSGGIFVVKGGAIYIYGNLGTDTCNRSIATNKGWQILII